MGFEAGWQLVGWICYVYGVSALIAALLPSGWYVEFSKSYARVSKLAIPPLFLLVLWMMVNAALSLAAYWVHADGGWATHGIALLCFCVNIALSNIWMMIFYLPYESQLKQQCNMTMSCILSASAALSAATFVYFLQAELASGFLVLPLCAWMGYCFVIMLSYEDTHCTPHYVHPDDYPMNSLLVNDNRAAESLEDSQKYN